MKNTFVSGLAFWAALGTCAMAETPFRLSPRGLLSITEVSSPAVSPDGRLVAFRTETASIERNSYGSTWYVVPVDGSWTPMHLADGGDPIRNSNGDLAIEPPRWSSDSRWLYYRAAFDGVVQVWRASADGRKVEQITSDSADVKSFELGDDERTLTYTTGLSREQISFSEQQEYNRGVLIDKNIPIGQNLFHSGFANGRLTSQRYTRGWMRREGVGEGSTARTRSIDLGTLAIRDVPFRENVDLDAGSLSISGNRSVSTETGWQVSLVYRGASYYLSVVPPNDPTARLVCELEACTDMVRSAAWRPGHEEIIFTRLDADRVSARSLWAWDPERNTSRLIARSDGMLAADQNGWEGGCAISTTEAICVETLPTRLPRLTTINLDTGERRILYEPDTAISDAIDLKVEPLTWTAGKTQFSGYFIHPRDNPIRAPLFVTFYSCPGFLRGGAGNEWPLYALADSGIAALCINRQAIDSDAQFAEENYTTGARSIRAAIDLLVDRDLIDPARIGLGGYSFGGEVAVWMATHSDIVSALSIASMPSLTPTHYWFHSLDPNYRASLMENWTLGIPEESPDRWQAMSLIHNIDKLDAPLLLQMPEQEYLPAVEIVGRLILASKPVELYAFPNEPHSKFQPRHKLAVYERNLDWFRFWLQDYEDPDPSKAEQYERWRAMRNLTSTRTS